MRPRVIIQVVEFSTVARAVKTVPAIFGPKKHNSRDIIGKRFDVVYAIKAAERQRRWVDIDAFAAIPYLLRNHRSELRADPSQRQCVIDGHHVENSVRKLLWQVCHRFCHDWKSWLNDDLDRQRC